MRGRMGIVRGGHCRRVDGGFGDDHAGGAAGQKERPPFGWHRKAVMQNEFCQMRTLSL